MRGGQMRATALKYRQKKNTCLGAVARKVRAHRHCKWRYFLFRLGSNLHFHCVGSSPGRITTVQHTTLALNGVRNQQQLSPSKPLAIIARASGDCTHDNLELIYSALVQTQLVWFQLYPGVVMAVELCQWVAGCVCAGSSHNIAMVPQFQARPLVLK